uniref:Uncharacterized protein n=1 Tax=Ananas comosus var. bracteatus TaxID=296719 RepID=A0A6V7Q6N5_ANACO|nr:unnamed protein product [Ananas comosus var. bracteatus]
MKRSIRVPFSALLLLMVAMCALLSFRVAVVVRGVIGGGGDAAGAAEDADVISAALLPLSAADPGEATLRKDAEFLLGGDIPQAVRPGRIDGTWRLELGHLEARPRPDMRAPIRLLLPKDYGIIPVFRRALRDWYSRLLFEPEVMSELPDLVKLPIDSHHARLRSSGSDGGGEPWVCPGVGFRGDDGSAVGSVGDGARRADVPLLLGVPSGDAGGGLCEEVSVFGFGKSTSAKHHYHTNQRAELDLHDYEAEYAVYRDLVRRPHAIPFLNESGFPVPRLVFYHPDY